MRTTIRKLAVAGAGIALGLLLSACTAAQSSADMEAKAKSATAAALGGQYTADSIEVADLQLFPAKATWQARTSGGAFACNSDETFARPDCQPAG